MKGKLLKTFKQFLIATLIVVMILPSFSYAATAAVENENNFSIGNSFSNLLVNLGITAPHQSNFTVTMNKSNRKKVYDEDGNEVFKEYFQAGDVLEIDVAFVGDLKTLSEDTKLGFYFGETGKVREVTEYTFNPEENTNEVHFRYTLQGATYDEDGNIVDRGDNGGLIFKYFDGEAIFDNNGTEGRTDFELPKNLAYYQNKIIADTVSPIVEVDSFDESKVIANEELYKYTPGEVDEENDNREYGKISPLKESDVKLISNKYIEITTDSKSDKYYIANGDETVEKESREIFVSLKDGNKTLVYRDKENGKYYINVKSNKNNIEKRLCFNDIFTTAEMSSIFSTETIDGEECIIVNKSKLFNYLDQQSYQTLMATNFELTTFISAVTSERLSINGISITVDESSKKKDTSKYLIEALKSEAVFNYENTVANERVTLKYDRTNANYVKDDKLVSSAEIYRLYQRTDTTVEPNTTYTVLYYNECNGKFYINVSPKETKIEAIDVSSYVEKVEDDDNYIFNLTVMYIDKEFMENNFVIADKAEGKNENGIVIANVNNDEDEEKIKWSTFINNVAADTAEGEETDDLNEKYVLKALKAYFKNVPSDTVTGETRIASLTKDDVKIYTLDEITYNGLYFDSKETKDEIEYVDSKGQTQKQKGTAYYIKKYSVSEAIIYSAVNEESKELEYFWLKADKKKEIVTEYIEFDAENNMYLNMSKYNNTSFDTNYGTYCKDVIRTTHNFEFSIEDLFEDDEICIPNCVDLAGNSSEIHLKCTAYTDEDDQEFEMVDKLYKEEPDENATEAELAKYIAPVIKVESKDGKEYKEEGNEKTVWFNKKGSTYEITALAHYRDGSVQVGFLDVTDPENTAEEPTTYKNATYVKYDDETGMTTWEYTVTDGTDDGSNVQDQGELFIKITDCACDTTMYTPAEKDEDDKVVVEAKNEKIVPFAKYYADSIAPVVEGITVNKITNYPIANDDVWDNDNYYERSYKDKTDLDVYTNVNTEISTDGKENIPDIKITMNISDETKMNTELAEVSYTSEEEPARFSYEDVYNESICNYNTENEPVSYKTTELYEHKKDLSTEKYKTYMSEIEYDIVRRETETNKVILEDDYTLYVYSNPYTSDDSVKKFDYIEGTWSEPSTSSFSYQIGEYINYHVDAKALEQGIAKPVVKVTDYAGNEAQYMINRIENSDCYYLVLVDTTEPTYTISNLIERTNEKTFEFDVEYEDRLIDDYAGSGISEYSSLRPTVTNGVIVKTASNGNKYTYTVMPDHDGYTKLYFGEGICKDKVNNESTIVKNPQIFIDTTAPELDDVTGIDGWVQSTTASIIAHDELSAFKYAFKFVEEGATEEPVTFTDADYVESNKKEINEKGTLYIGLKDELGNERITSVKVSYIDNIEPIINSVSVNGISATETQVTISATDSESGVAEYSFNGGESWQTTPVKSFNKSYTIDAEDIKVKDVAGNIATYGEEDVNVDIITSRTPVLKIGELYEYYTIPTGETEATINLELEADADNACELYYYVSNTEVDDYSKVTFTKANGYNKYTQPVKLGEGKWYIYEYAVDAVTRIESGVYSYSDGIEVGKSTITFNADTTEITENGVNVTINYGRGLTENRLAGFENSREANLTTVKVTENGNVYAEATDMAGNKVYATYTVENIRKVTNEDVENVTEPTVIFDTTSTDSKISKVIVSEEVNGKNYIVIQPNVTLDELKEDIVTNCDIKVMNADKTSEIKSDVDLSTGKVMTVSGLNAEYVIVVKGDVNGDGNVNMLDIIKINKSISNRVTLTEAQEYAANVNGDDKISIVDILKVNKYRTRRISKL